MVHWGCLWSPTEQADIVVMMLCTSGSDAKDPYSGAGCWEAERSAFQWQGMPQSETLWAWRLFCFPVGSVGNSLMLGDVVVVVTQEAF